LIYFSIDKSVSTHYDSDKALHETKQLKMDFKNMKEIEESRFYVTDIEFDHEGQLDETEIQELKDEYCNKYYKAINEEDLNDVITFKSGWCVSSLEYENLENV